MFIQHTGPIAWELCLLILLGQGAAADDPLDVLLSRLGLIRRRRRRVPLVRWAIFVLPFEWKCRATTRHNGVVHLFLILSMTRPDNPPPPPESPGYAKEAQRGLQVAF